jgi:hypothetical protein
MNMQHCLVVLENSDAAWQATYTAYDVAARSGSSLVGAVVEPSQGDPSMRRKFETGARAAGIRVTAHSIPSLSVESLQDLIPPVDEVFISRASLSSPTLLDDLLAGLACPLWIIPEQRTIRRVMIATLSGAADAPEMELGISLMRRWEILLEILVTSESVERLNRDQTLDGDISQRVVPQLSLSTFLKRVSDDDIDLAVLPWPNEAISIWEACTRANCLLAVCPTLNSH